MSALNSLIERLRTVQAGGGITPTREVVDLYMACTPDERRFACGYAPAWLHQATVHLDRTLFDWLHSNGESHPNVTTEYDEPHAAIQQILIDLGRMPDGQGGITRSWSDDMNLETNLIHQSKLDDLKEALRKEGCQLERKVVTRGRRSAWYEVTKDGVRIGGLADPDEWSTYYTWIPAKPYQTIRESIDDAAQTDEVTP